MMRSICFVDDDEEEIRRFRRYIGDRYIVGAGRTLNDAIGELKSQGVRKPDLVLLDLYYGPTTSAEMRANISDAYEKLSREGIKLRQQLLEAGQSTSGGFKLADEVDKKFRNIPRMFFSRKAFVTDYQEAHERGIPVLKKPDPSKDDTGQTREVQYDVAFGRHRDEIFRHIDRVIDQSTWWMRHRERVVGIIEGVVGSAVFSVIGWFLGKLLSFF